MHLSRYRLSQKQVSHQSCLGPGPNWDNLDCESLHGPVGRVILLVKPDSRACRGMENVHHQVHLIASLIDILLIDANDVDPEAIPEKWVF